MEKIKGKKSKNDVVVEVPINNVKIKIGINIRPNWKDALNVIKNYYHIVLYTASHQSYTNAILEYLEPNKEYFEYILYRSNCIPKTINDKQVYIKDLDIFKYYNLKNVILIDNSSLIYECHIDNLIPIVPFYNSKNDKELVVLSYYLLSIMNYDDLRIANKKFINMNQFLIEAKKEKEIEENEKEQIIDTLDDDFNNDNNNNDDNNKDNNDKNNDNNNNKDENKTNKNDIIYLKENSS